MSAGDRLVTVGRVGAPHGRDGSFRVDAPLRVPDSAAGRDLLREGSEVELAGSQRRVARLAGTQERPLLRVEGIEDRSAAAALRGEPLRVAEHEAPLGPDEWLVDDLVGARVEGVGEVRRVLAAPSCDLLEVGEERTLVPLVSDAIRRIDPETGVIEVDRRFLGLVGEREGEDEPRPPAPGRAGRAPSGPTAP